MSPPAPLRLLPLLRPELPRVVVGGVCLLVTNVLGLAIPWLLKQAIDALSADRADVLAFVGRTAALMVALAVGQAMIRTASRILIFNAGRNVEYRLRGDLFGRLMRRPLPFFATHPVGDLMSRLTNDLSAVRMLFGPGILNIANTAIVYATGIALLLRIHPTLTAVALLPFPLVIAFGRLSSRRLYRANRTLSDQLGVMSTALQEDLAGLPTIRAYALEDRRQEAFRTLGEDYYRKSISLVRTRGLLSPIFALVAALGTLIVMWRGGHEVIAGRMTVGELVAFNAYLGYLAWPTIALGWVLSLWQRGIAGWRRVQELLSETAPPAEGTVSASGEDGAPAAVRVAHLNVRRGDHAALEDVSFDLPAGKILAVVGRTGSGKSTLADALLRFTPVPAGTIFLGGRDICELPDEVLRGQVGYAPQEAFLFSATLAENIAFAQGRIDGALDEETRQRVRAAAEAAGLGRDVAGFPDGYDTLVGERGITLSGGQRQRVAIARALFANRPLLVLDDSLSAVDAETERAILESLEAELEGRTAILISHRVAAVRRAHEILVLERGRVVERGTHAALVARGGVYGEIYREQLLEEAPGAPPDRSRPEATQ